MLPNSKLYNVQGDCSQLEFSVELALLGHSGQPGALLNFDNFQRRKQASRGIGLLDTSGEEDARREVLEKRTVDWMEAIPKPTISIENFVGEDEDAVQNEPETEEGIRDEEEDQVPEDPSQSQTLPRQQTVTRSAVLSHRIFTVLNAKESIAVEASLLSGQTQIRQKRVAPIEQTALKQPIRWDLPTEQRQRNREAPVVVQTMQIWAFLGEKGESEYDTADEFLLWELCLLNGRMLRVQPDLGQRRVVSRRQQAFLATLAFDQQLLFDSLSDEAIGKQQEWLPFERADDEGSAPFDVPEGNADYWLHYLVEISKARDFTRDYLRVEWLLDLPENMRLMQPEMNEGSTQQCATKGQGREDIAHFGHLLQLSLNRRPASSDCSKAGLSWPRLLLRVVAKDSWGRFFVEGYVSFPLPVSPGEESHRLECWRPTNGGESKADALRNAHLGQAVDLADFKVAGARDIHGKWSSFFTRQGLRIESSGSLEISVRSMHQCRHFLTREMAASLRYSRMAQRAGLYGGLHWRIARVLEEFERARRQLLALRARRAKDGSIRRAF